METNQAYPNIIERIGQWFRESVMVKLFSIGFLVLILLIPLALIENLINERQSRAEEVMKEVSEKWSGTQNLSGPILVIPYKEYERIDRGKNGIEILEHTKKYFFLPTDLNVTGKVDPEVRHRGIFDAVVYRSILNIKADFTKPDFDALNIAAKDILWEKAHMIFSITDVRGISDTLTFRVGEQNMNTEPSKNLGVQITKISNQSNRYTSTNESSFSTDGIVAKLNWKTADDFKSNTVIKLNLKGSQNLNFTPTGKTTSVQLEGKWGNPSFDGKFIPEASTITDSTFSANWKILHYNRPFSQQWNHDDEVLAGSEFGVNLLVPVDQYQKSMRTSKYGLLVIILTFVALFLVEITNKIRIHPFQYILIGAALVIYYTLLLSFSEQLGYNAAYWIATIATVTLVSMYAISFLKKFRLVILLTGLMIIFYTFIFVIMLQQDLSLLLGSVGLFIIIALLMYFSRKISWYKEVAS
jgi:inner membrane protein